MPTIIREKLILNGGDGGDRVRLRVGPADDAHDIRGLMLHREVNNARNLGFGNMTPGAGATAASAAVQSGPSWNAGLSLLLRPSPQANPFSIYGVARFVAVVPNATGILATAFNPNTASKTLTLPGLMSLAIR
jgi:hypothetical protein